MFTAYFDESGTSDNEDVAVVAGYLSSVAMWNTFNARWSKLLAQYGIKQMHRSELETFHGEFSGWSPIRRTEFVQKAHTIIKRCTYLPFGVAIVKRDFEEAFPLGHAARRFGLYSWGVHGCLTALGKWCQTKNLKEPISFVFEAGSAGRDQVDKTFAMLHKNNPDRSADDCQIRSWTFADKDVLPLQAADLIAYELYKLTVNAVIEQSKRKMRLSVRDLLKNTDYNWLFWYDKQVFEGLLREKVPGWDY
jgi:Protein of unknown function (DUF3800)